MTSFLTLYFRSMYFLVILALLGKVTGEMFFYHHEGKSNHTLNCRKSAAGGETVWYKAEDTLEQFSRICQSDKSQEVNMSRCQSRDHVVNCTAKTLSVSDFPHGGIFACESVTDKRTPQSCQLLINATHCNQYDFFIEAIVNKTTDDLVFENITAKTETTLSVNEDNNATLSCEFKMKNSLPFVLYWIKYTEPSKCLHSATVQHSEFAYDLNCCVDGKIKERLYGTTTSNPTSTHQIHNLVISKFMPSDNGMYLCVANIWSSGKHHWKIVNNTFLKMYTPPKHWWQYIIIAILAGISIISGVIWYICWKRRHSEGKRVTQLQRTQDATEMPEDECSPYAISSSIGIHGNEAVYSLVTKPNYNPDGASSALSDSAACRMQQGCVYDVMYG